ncbi:hypothetical protein QNI26_22520, partial [Bacillus velezensis]|uniref:hypothetical protein n=2 Tax=Bacillus TaxID=1386 RepID=UPI00335808D1
SCWRRIGADGRTSPSAAARATRSDQTTSRRLVGSVPGREANSSGSNSDRFKNETVEQLR